MLFINKSEAEVNSAFKILLLAVSCFLLFKLIKAAELPVIFKFIYLISSKYNIIKVNIYNCNYTLSWVKLKKAFFFNKRSYIDSFNKVFLNISLF